MAIMHSYSQLGMVIFRARPYVSHTHPLCRNEILIYETGI
jgi:hypothetical protein